MTQPAYNQALGTARGSDALRRRIVEEFTDFRVEGPQYRLVEKDSAGDA